MRRIKRTSDFEISVELKSDQFLAPPREAQRAWLLTRAVSELASDLLSLDRLARSFVPGTEGVPTHDRTQAPLSDQEIMEDWQFPIMGAMAGVVTESHGEVLEVGFGRGISAQYIQERGVRSHTIIECNDSVVDRFHSWRNRYPERDIRLIHGRWQDVVDQLGTYDGVFFHTYPLNEEEIIEHVVRSTTFAEHFFRVAASVLREGGVFTYLTNEIDSFSREHQRLLFRHFRSIALRIAGPLNLPPDLADAWWADTMVVVRAEK